jgi:hypothetical protein
MKKLILAIALAVIAILSVIGTTIVAGAPPDNKPTEAWDIILDSVNDVLTRIGAFPTTNYASIAAAVEDIRAKVMGVESSLNTTDGKVEAIQASVDYLQSSLNTTDGKVEAIQASVDAVQASVDDIQLSVDNATSNITFMASDMGVHTLVTDSPPETEEILAFEYDQVAHVSLTVAEQYFGSGDQVWVNIFFGSYGPAIILIDGASAPKTVEFDAKEWVLYGYSTDMYEKVCWAYTVTYPANIAD